MHHFDRRGALESRTAYLQGLCDNTQYPRIEDTLWILHQWAQDAKILGEYNPDKTIGPFVEQCILADILNYGRHVQRWDRRDHGLSVQQQRAKTPTQYINALNQAHKQHHQLCTMNLDILLLLGQVLQMAYRLRDSGDFTTQNGTHELDAALRTNPQPNTTKPYLDMGNVSALIRYLQGMQKMEETAWEFCGAVQNKYVIQYLASPTTL